MCMCAPAYLCLIHIDTNNFIEAGVKPAKRGGGEAGAGGEGGEVRQLGMQVDMKRDAMVEQEKALVEVCQMCAMTHLYALHPCVCYDSFLCVT